MKPSVRGDITQVTYANKETVHLVGIAIHVQNLFVSQMSIMAHVLLGL